MSAVLIRTAPPQLPATAGTDVDAPASSLRGSVAEGLVVAVAPSTGRFRPSGAAAAPGTGAAPAGALLGHVTGGRGRADAVHAPIAGTVARLLVRPGQLVVRGQALVWLRTAPMAGEGR